MTKVVKSYTSNYKITTKDAGTITLDTGDNQGTVFITGNLEIKGDSTTIETEELKIQDNIIVLSNGTQGAGLPSSVNFRSGIEIDRGSLPNAQWLFDEQISWELGGTAGSGAFYSQTDDGTKLPINTPGIVAQGNFYIDTGIGVITVTNTPDYEEKIFNYESGTIVSGTNGNIIIDDDSIPNAKAVVDYVDFRLQDQFYSSISTGDTKVETIDALHPILDIVAVNPDDNNTTVIQTQGLHGFTISDIVNISGIQANGDPLENLNQNNISIIEIISPFILRLDISVTGADSNTYVENSGTITKTGFVESNISFEVEGTEIANLYSDRFVVDGIVMRESEIAAIGSNEDLTLIGNAAGSVVVRDVLEIPKSLEAPELAPESGTKIYTDDPKTGTTGLYYVNSNDTRDELVSKNRSLLFSMIF